MIRKATIKRLLKKFVAPIYRKNLKNREFSIISNNCWGGTIYDRYNLPYKTPTIGLWIPPKDYLRFVSNLEYYLQQDVKQIAWYDSHVKEILKERKKSGRYKKNLDEFIIGRIGDVDVVFLHYDSFEIAKEKWNRRKKRINYDNLIIKFNDQNNASLEDLEEFLRLKHKNKILFTAYEGLNNTENVIYFPQYAQVGFVEDDYKYLYDVMDVTQYLNNVM